MGKLGYGLSGMSTPNLDADQANMIIGALRQLERHFSSEIEDLPYDVVFPENLFNQMVEQIRVIFSDLPLDQFDVGDKILEDDFVFEDHEGDVITLIFNFPKGDEAIVRIYPLQASEDWTLEALRALLVRSRLDRKIEELRRKANSEIRDFYPPHIKEFLEKERQAASMALALLDPEKQID